MKVNSRVSHRATRPAIAKVSGSLRATPLAEIVCSLVAPLPFKRGLEIAAVMALKVRLKPNPKPHKNTRSGKGRLMVLAYHEAGHAVVSSVLGLAPTEIKMSSSGPPFDKHTLYNGLTSYDPDHGISLRAELVRLLAGYAADDRLRGVLYGRDTILYRSIEESDEGGDIRKAIGYLRDEAHVDNIEADGLLSNKVWPICRVLVAKHWPAIERVARALLRDGHLDGEQLQCLIDRRKSGQTRRATEDRRRATGKTIIDSSAHRLSLPVRNKPT